jgi:hypothetical protein
MNIRPGFVGKIPPPKGFMSWTTFFPNFVLFFIFLILLYHPENILYNGDFIGPC